MENNLKVVVLLRAYSFCESIFYKNYIFVVFVLIILDQYYCIGPKIWVHFQILENIGQQNIAPF